MNGGEGVGLLSRKVERKMKISQHYSQRRTHTLILLYTVEPPNNGHTRSESFVLCREVVLISEVAN